MGAKQPSLVHESAGCKERQHANAAHVESQGKALDGVLDACSQWPPCLGRKFQHEATLADQIEADMGGPVLAPVKPGGGGGQLHGQLRDLRLRVLAVPGNGLYPMPILVAGGKVHLLIEAGGIGPQRGLHQTHGFDKLLPVRGAQKPQTGNAVAHGNLVGRLTLAFQVNHAFDGQPLFEQLVLDPTAGEMGKRTLV